MRTDQQGRKWMIDAALFAGFVVSMMLDLTGIGVHQWLGMAVGALAGYHLLSHSRWVKAVTQRFFGRTSSQARRFYLVDAGLLAGFAVIGLTGLVISTWLDLSLQNYAAWRNVHVAASVVTLGLVVLKIGLHWRWIASVARRSIFGTQPAAGSGGAVQPVAASAVGRRDFVRLMGVVGVTALLAGVNAMAGEPGAQADAADGSEATISAAQTAAEGCVVRCSRSCSYPGHCRRYVDSDGDGRCDLGECVASSALGAGLAAGALAAGSLAAPSAGRGGKERHGPRTW